MQLTSQITFETCIWDQLLEHNARMLHLLANRGHSLLRFSLAASSQLLGYFLVVDKATIVSTNIFYFHEVSSASAFVYSLCCIFFAIAMC